MLSCACVLGGQAQDSMKLVAKGAPARSPLPGVAAWSQRTYATPHSAQECVSLAPPSGCRGAPSAWRGAHCIH